MMFNNDMPTAPCPCRKCEDRELGCHSHCERYAEFKERVEEINKIRRAESDRYAMSDTKRQWLRKRYRKNGRKNVANV